LSSDHAQELREQLDRYVKAARKVTGSTARPARVRTTTANDTKNKEIRYWARERGFDVNDRGRIPAYIMARHEAETPSEPQPASASGQLSSAGLVIRIMLPAREFTWNPQYCPVFLEQKTRTARRMPGIAVRVSASARYNISSAPLRSRGDNSAASRTPEDRCSAVSSSHEIAETRDTHHEPFALQHPVRLAAGLPGVSVLSAKTGDRRYRLASPRRSAGYLRPDHRR
jgi:Lsr2